MLIVETVGRIRREHFIKGKSIKEIARDLSVSRNTVRKILRSGETSFSYEREVQPRRRLGRWEADLDRMLTENARKTPRERLSLIRLYEDLRDLGYAGGYDAVRRYARTWGRKHESQAAAAFVPLSFAPGEAYQFDWSHEIVVMNGATVTVKVAHVRLCHSRMMFFRAYPRETQEMVFDAHERAFAFFKGACTRGIYDNMKTAVDAIFVGKDADTIDASCKCAVIIWLIRWPAHLPWVGVRPNRGRRPRKSAGRAGREPGRPRTRTFLHAAPSARRLRSSQGDPT
jgi:transposase